MRRRGLLTVLTILSAGVGEATQPWNSTAVISHAHNVARKANVLQIAQGFLLHPWIHEVVVVAQGPEATSGLESLFLQPRVRFHVVDNHPHINARWNISIATDSFIMNDDDRILYPGRLYSAFAIWELDRQSVVTTSPYRCIGASRYNHAPCTGRNMVVPAVTIYPAALMSVYNEDRYHMAREVVRLQSGHCDDMLVSLLHTARFPGAPKVACTCNGGDCTRMMSDAHNGISGRIWSIFRKRERQECAGMLLSTLGADAVVATQSSIVIREIAD